MEHWDFFIRGLDKGLKEGLKEGLKVGSIEGINVINGKNDHLMTPDEKAKYNRKRWRWEFQKKLEKKHQILNSEPIPAAYR